MAILYSVKDWDYNFENHDTRKLKNLLWIPLPVKQDGDGYTELMEHENGAAHLGAWTAIVQLAAKCRPKRGVLMRQDGSPHTPRSIGRITRISPDVLGEAIPRLLQIGWLQQDTVNLPEERGIAAAKGEIDGDTGSTGSTGSEGSTGNLTNLSLDNKPKDVDEFPLPKKLPKKGRDYIYPSWFIAVKNFYPERQGGQNWPDTYSRCRSIVLEKQATVEELAEAAKRYYQEQDVGGNIGTEYVAQASTFYSPAKGKWREILGEGWKPPKKKEGGDDGFNPGYLNKKNWRG